MARKQSSFDYDKLDSAIQDFLRQKEREINKLLDRKQLRCRYSLGEKVVEVRSFLKQNDKNCYSAWVKKHIQQAEATLNEHFYCYDYTKKHLEGIAAILEANPKISYSVLVKLGEPKATKDIKQRFAELIKSGKRITCPEVDEAIADKLLTTIPSNQMDDLEKPLIEIKELLNSQNNEESNYHKWLQKYYWIFGLEYKLIESHKNLDDKRIPDFTGIRVYDDFRDVFEIKAAFIPWFQKDGRFNSKFNEAWNQVEEYLNFAIEDKDYLRRKGLNFDNPKCYLILGYDLSEKQIKKIRTKARVNPAINFRTYDDLMAWAENTINFVKKHKGRK